MLSPSQEDYLEEIYRLSLLKDKVRVSDIADRLNVSSPSVVKALKRLNDENYIRYKQYVEITLTETGERLGSLLVRRNSMLQDFLKTINSDCDIAKEAESMEHYLSSSTIFAIESLIAFLKIDPVRELFAKFNKASGQRHWSRDIQE